MKAANSSAVPKIPGFLNAMGRIQALKSGTTSHSARELMNTRSASGSMIYSLERRGGAVLCAGCCCDD